MAHKDMLAFVQPLCQQLADRMQYRLVDVELVKEGPGMYLRIYLNKPGGITINDCEAYHRVIQPQLERVDYDFLEVCSPGLDRPLKTAEDFAQGVGTLVEVRLFKPVDGAKQYTGTLVGLIDGAVTIETEQGQRAFAQKSVALVKPVLDIAGIDDVIFEDEAPEGEAGTEPVQGEGE